MPIGSSDGAQFEDEFDYLSQTGSTEAPLKITVYKNAPEGDDPYDELQSSRFDMLDKMGAHADFDKIQDPASDNVIDLRGQDERYNAFLGKYRYIMNNIEPGGYRDRVLNNLADGLYDPGTFTAVVGNNLLDMSVRSPLYAPNQLSKDAGFEDEGPNTLDPFSEAARRTRQSVMPPEGRAEGGTTKFLESAGKDIKKFGSHLMDAITLGPKLMEKAYKGEIDLSSEEGVKHVNDIAMTFGTAGLMTAPLKPGVGMFGGRMSQDAIRLSEKMEKAGLSEHTIKDITGLERGAEGKWRREFSDADAQFYPSGLKQEAGGIRAANLGHVFDHPEFFKAYPEAADNVLVAFDPNLKNSVAYYHPKAQMIVIGPKAMADRELTRQTILHELQHYIQEVEGFAQGSPPKAAHLPAELRDQMRGYLIRKYGKQDLKEIEQAIIEEQAGVVKGDWSSVGMMSSRDLAQNLLNSTDWKLYKAVAGEQEAFNVMTRSHMTSEQIRKSLGKDTEDVPRSEQIIHTEKDFHVGSQYQIEKPPMETQTMAKHMWGRNAEAYTFVTKDGQKGLLAVKAQGDTLRVEYITVLNDLAPDADMRSRANSIGFAEVRDILRELKKQYPDVKKIAGFRVSGARPMSAETEANIRAMVEEPTPKKIVGYEIYDLHEKKIVGNTYNVSNPDRRLSVARRARTRADKLNLDYGAHRYTAKPIYEDGSKGFGS